MAPPSMLISATILRSHDEAIQNWHADAPHSATASPPDVVSQDPQQTLLALTVSQHLANIELWHQEDEARSPYASDGTIARVKHNIDRLNQRRNDLVEALDVQLLAEAGPQNESAPLHSETPGLIIDRLSILALKIFHTAEEATRLSASEEHRTRNSARLAVLEQQRNDLAGCLDSLWHDVTHGQRRFHLYRQLKMYNDPDLNPVLYRDIP